MLNTPAAETKQVAEDRETRPQEFLGRLRAAAGPAFRPMAEQLADAAGAAPFGPLGYAPRDHAHPPAAAARQAGLGGRKKRGA